MPEIAELVGNDEASKIIRARELNDYMNAKAMQSAFIKLMSANKDVISTLVSKLKNRLEAENKVN